MSPNISSTLSTIVLCHWPTGHAHNFQPDNTFGRPTVRVAEVVPETQAAGQPQHNVPSKDDADAEICIERLKAHLGDASNIAEDPAFLKSTALGDCELGTLLGSGGCGKVYAIKTPGNVEYVLKVIRYKWSKDKHRKWGPPTSRRHAEWVFDVSQELIREGRLLQSLAPHPHIIKCLDIIGGDGSKGAPFAGIIMPKMKGDAMELFKDLKPMYAHLVWRFFVQMLAALEHIHAHGFAHLDLKVENVLYEFDDKAGEIAFKLADFGYAAPEDDVPTWAVGTWEYAAPEARTGEACYESDIWSLMVSVAWAMDAGGFRKWFDEKVDLSRPKDFNAMAKDLKSIVTQDRRLKRFKDCVNKSAFLRPSAREVRGRVKGMGGWLG